MEIILFYISLLYGKHGFHITLAEKKGPPVPWKGRQKRTARIILQMQERSGSASVAGNSVFQASQSDFLSRLCCVSSHAQTQRKGQDQCFLLWLWHMGWSHLRSGWQSVSTQWGTWLGFYLDCELFSAEILHPIVSYDILGSMSRQINK